MTAPTKEQPRLSPSIAKILINRSPLHAWQAHRLLGGGDGSDVSTTAQDTGKILEALVFGVPMERFVVIDAADFRTKAAQEARDKAYTDGKTPVLAIALGVLKAGAIVIRDRLAKQGVVFDHGEYQKVVEWVDPVTGCLCKGIIDYWQDGISWDFKSTEDASPRKFVRKFVDFGYDIQAAAYPEGIETTIPEYIGRSRMIFAVAETSPPYVVQLYEPSGMMRDLGANKWHEAKRQWMNCMESGEWPSYFKGVGQLEPLPWHMDFLTDVEPAEALS